MPDYSWPGLFVPVGAASPPLRLVVLAAGPVEFALGSFGPLADVGDSRLQRGCPALVRLPEFVPYGVGVGLLGLAANPMTNMTSSRATGRLPALCRPSRCDRGSGLSQAGRWRETVPRLVSQMATTRSCRFPGRETTARCR